MTNTARNEQQPPMIPPEYTAWGRLQPVKNASSNYWWTKAVQQESGRRGLLVYNSEEKDFFLEGEETLQLLAFLLEDAATDLIETCGEAGVKRCAREVELVREAWWSVETKKARLLLQSHQAGGEEGQDAEHSYGH